MFIKIQKTGDDSINALNTDYIVRIYEKTMRYPQGPVVITVIVMHDGSQHETLETLTRLLTRIALITHIKDKCGALPEEKAPWNP